jgi:hypothetical protein
LATATQALPTEKEKPKYGPGVLAGIEVSDIADAEVTKDEEGELRELCKAASKRDYPARLIEVIQAWEAALFYRGFQFLIPQRGGGWIIPGESTGYGPSMQMDLALLPTNIYSAHAQIVISSLTRSVPSVRFQPQDETKAAQITAAESAEKFVKVIERNNDLVMIQTDAARYLWCDGRFLYWSRFVKDGQRFGWEGDDTSPDVVPENEPPEEQADSAVAAEEAKEAGGPGQTEEEEEQGEANKSDKQEEEELEDALAGRTARGQEVRTAHGKLAVKLVPMMADKLCEVDVLQFEEEVDEARAKGMFLDKADDIKATATGQSEGMIARLARQNVKLGMQSTYVTSDSIAADVTIQRTWIRPTYFMRVTKKPVRDSLIQKFPDGVRVVFVGETFCSARNESMDWSWALGHAYSGDGQNRNALGTSLMPIQKRLNNWLDLMNDFFVRAIPKKWMDNKTFNVDAIRTQTNVPGDIGSFKRVPGVPVTELVWVEPAVVPPQSLADFVKEYSSELAELMSGAYPALAGGATDTDTFRGMALQRDQALGRLGPTWHSIQNAEAESMKQLVKWGARCRDKSINERIPGSEPIRLEVNDLKGDILCFAESDENFPETYPQKQQRLMSFMEQSVKNPMLGEVLYNASNLRFLQNMLALSDLYIPQVASSDKQLGELEILLKNKPVPNPVFLKAKSAIEQLKAHNVDPGAFAQAEQELADMPQEVTSIEVDMEVEDHETEAATCWQYMTSPDGRKAKRTNADGYKNVRLHFMAHVKAGQEKAAQANAPGQQKPPSKAINLKDLMPGAERAQLLAQGGIKAEQPPPVAPMAAPGAGAPPAGPAPPPTPAAPPVLAGAR